MPIHELIVLSAFIVVIFLLLAWTQIAFWDWLNERDEK